MSLLEERGEVVAAARCNTALGSLAVVLNNLTAAIKLVQQCLTNLVVRRQLLSLQLHLRLYVSDLLPLFTCQLLLLQAGVAYFLPLFGLPFL